jgi:hypothetical protein
MLMDEHFFAKSFKVDPDALAGMVIITCFVRFAISFKLLKEEDILVLWALDSIEYDSVGKDAERGDPPR